MCFKSKSQENVPANNYHLKVEKLGVAQLYIMASCKLIIVTIIAVHVH